MGKSSAPQRTFDANASVARQQQQNTANVAQQQAANRPDTQDSYGNTVSWQANGTDANGNPQYRQVQQMGAEAQGYAQGLGQLGQRYLSGAQSMLDRNGTQAGGVNDQAAKYFDASTATLQKVQGERTSALDAQLRNQGVQPGTAAYDKAMRVAETANQDALTNAYSQAQQQAHSMAGQDWDREVSSLQSLSSPGVQYMGRSISGDRISPNQLNVGNVNTMQADQAQYQSEVDRDRARQQQQQALWGAAAGVAGAGLNFMSGGAFGGLSSLGSSMGSQGAGYNPDYGMGGTTYAEGYNRGAGRYGGGYN